MQRVKTRLSVATNAGQVNEILGAHADGSSPFPSPVGRNQTPAGMKENYGLGWSAGAAFGHGGALATNMTIDPTRGLIFVWLVQHSGYPGEGGKAQGAFKQAAEAQFAKKP